MPIERIRFENFRGYASADLQLDANEQMIVITGPNGAGKSTVLEALEFGLIGQGRTRRLDEMVRWGAEIEGMEVEVVFTVGQDRYRVVRRRDRTTTAVLFGNDIPLVEGAEAVTAAVCALFGMDPAGLRLAVIARQKDLAAILKFGAPDRVKALSRLLRLTAVTNARADARGLVRDAEAARKRLPTVGNVVDAARELSAAEATCKAREAAEAESRAALADLEARIDAMRGIDETYMEAERRLSSVQTAHALHQADLTRVRAELDQLVVPAEPGPAATPAELEARTTQVERNIATAEAAERLRQQRSMLSRELDGVVARLVKVDARLAVIGHGPDVARAADDADVAEEAARVALVAAQERVTELRAEWRAADDAVVRAEKRRTVMESLGEVCDACGQGIPHDHAVRMLDDAVAAVADATARRAAVADAGQQARRDAAAAEAALDAARSARAGIAARLQEVATLEGERAELSRRRDVYAGQIERLDVSDVDLDALYAQRAAVAIATAEARAADDQRAARVRALARKAELEEAVAAAEARVEIAALEVAAAVIGDDLQEAYRQRAALIEQQTAEAHFLSELSAATATARETRAHAEGMLRQMNELAGLHRKVADEAATAINAEHLLDAVERFLGSSIRPSLAAAVGDLLNAMSGGRFSRVKVTDDYVFLVEDGGTFRRIDQLSGGEEDLVALAVRLGIAEVVAERHGGSCGFLVLDEVWGSQDSGRRESIMAALRALRARYGQIWCISHVGGLEDAGDRVFRVEHDDAGVATIS